MELPGSSAEKPVAYPVADRMPWEKAEMIAFGGARVRLTEEDPAATVILLAAVEYASMVR